MTNESRRVLVVDDEDMVTRNLKMLLKTETIFEPVTFNSAEQALEYVKAETLDAIVADFIMPGMNGFDFLKQAKEIQPSASRLLLTGYADKESAIRAINEIGLFYYLEKPWDNDFLLTLLDRATERSQLLRQLSDTTSSLEELRGQILKMLI